ncbi:hypothetical protein [Moorella sp. ACPs]|uniref:hypothetical protein n=1 Tax=Neomoorella carbonis TaxID=3062783 RepID=UPI0032433D96
MAIEKIYNAIKRLPPAEREKLRHLLDNEESNNENTKAFERAAGSWTDFDADGFIEEIYHRRNSVGRKGSEW